MEGDDVVDTVEELRTHNLAQHLTRGVGGHDDDGVLEVDHAALVIRESAVVQYLQEGVEHVGMGLLYLVEEDHGIRLASYCLGQLATLVVAHISWRRADEPCHAELLLILAHIDTRHHVLVVEEILGERLGKFGLTHTGRAEEDKRGDRSLGVLQSGS